MPTFWNFLASRKLQPIMPHTRNQSYSYLLVLIQQYATFSIITFHWWAKNYYDSPSGSKLLLIVACLNWLVIVINSLISRRTALTFQGKLVWVKIYQKTNKVVVRRAFILYMITYAVNKENKNEKKTFRGSTKSKTSKYFIT